MIKQFVCTKDKDLAARLTGQLYFVSWDNDVYTFVNNEKITFSAEDAAKVFYTNKLTF